MRCEPRVDYLYTRRNVSSPSEILVQCSEVGTTAARYIHFLAFCLAVHNQALFLILHAIYRTRFSQQLTIAQSIKKISFLRVTKSKRFNYLAQSVRCNNVWQHSSVLAGRGYATSLFLATRACPSLTSPFLSAKKGRVIRALDIRLLFIFSPFTSKLF